MKVVIGYRTKDHLDEAMRSLGATAERVHAISIDVTDRPGMERSAAETVQVFGKIHVLVNNAGVAGFAPVSGITYADWDWIMNVNVNGVFNGIHAFLPHIQAHGEGGQIITTSSTAGLIVSRGMVSYSTSKFAVVGLMEALRADLADMNIGVSVYCPGLVKSNIGYSGRNRPSNLADSGFNRQPRAGASAELLMKNFMDPSEAGQHVLRGMRNNDLYILTHPEYEQVIRDRNEALIASMPTDLRPPEGREAMIRNEFRTSIYSTERDRKLCAQAARAKGMR
jgi:NAD(P)-dependent dehydrogenase (short-subunit alcohol dehydrogenase family)